MLNPMDLEGPAAKKACTEAKQYEEEAPHCEGGPDISKPTILYPISHTIQVTICIPSEYMPMVHYAEERSKASGKFVTKTYYHCTICPHWSQNKDSTHNHTCRHLNVSLACSWPNHGKTYDAPDGLVAHIDKKHGGILAPTAISKEEAEAMVVGSQNPNKLSHVSLFIINKL